MSTSGRDSLAMPFASAVGFTDQAEGILYVFPGVAEVNGVTHEACGLTTAAAIWNFKHGQRHPAAVDPAAFEKVVEDVRQGWGYPWLRMLMARQTDAPAADPPILSVEHILQHRRNFALATLVSRDPMSYEVLSPAEQATVLVGATNLLKAHNNDVKGPTRSQLTFNSPGKMHMPMAFRQEWNVVTVDGYFETTVFLLRTAPSTFGVTTGFTIWQLRWPDRAYQKSGQDMQRARAVFERQFGLVGYGSNRLLLTAEPSRPGLTRCWCRSSPLYVRRPPDALQPLVNLGDMGRLLSERPRPLKSYWDGGEAVHSDAEVLLIGGLLVLLGESTMLRKDGGDSRFGIVWSDGRVQNTLAELRPAPPVPQHKLHLASVTPLDPS